MTIQPFSFRCDTCACTEWITLVWFLVLVNSSNAFCWLYCDLKWNEMKNSVLKLFVLFFEMKLMKIIYSFAEACSSRSTPRPRPPTPAPRPNITFPTYKCPPAYAAYYCLNEARCFTVKIGDSLLYNCE